MTDGKRKAIATVVYWKRQYDDSNPDIGQEPSIFSTIADIAFELKAKTDKNNIEIIANRS